MEVKLLEMKFCNTEIPKEFHDFDVITDEETQVSFLRKDCFDRLIKKFIHEKQLVWVDYNGCKIDDGKYLCVIKSPPEISNLPVRQSVMEFRDGRWYGNLQGKEIVTHFTKLVYPKND